MMRGLVNQPIQISNRGQVAIFVFLVLLIGLTITISLASRALRDFQSSGQTDFSSRSYAAAEAGVEEVLRQGISSVTAGTWYYSTSSATPANSFTATNPARTTYQYRVDPQPAPTFTLQQDNATQLSLLPQTGGGMYSGTLYIFWGNVADVAPGDPTGENVAGHRPSLELTFLNSDSKGNFTSHKLGLNAEAGKSNNLTDPGNTVTVQGAATTVKNASGPVTTGQTDPSANPNFSSQFTSYATLTISSSDNFQYLRIRPLYNHATIGIEDGNTKAPFLTPQAFTITSRGIAGNTTGQVGSAVREVQVTKSLPTLPAIFDYVFFSGSTAAVGH